MSYVVQGDKNYRGGYASSKNYFGSEELRVATSTFENYVEGTILLTAIVFFVFLFLIGVSFFLMCFARSVVSL